MTICIAALCDKGKSCVVAADREITIGFPLNIAFEHHERKIDALTDHCLVLSAGNALVAAEVITAARQQLVAAGSHNVKLACERLRETYIGVHMERAEQTILAPRGWTLEKFKAEAAQKVPFQLYQQIDQLFWHFNLQPKFPFHAIHEPTRPIPC